LDVGLELGRFVRENQKAGLVVVGLAHLIELEVVGNFSAQSVEHQDDVVQRFFLFAQLLGFLGVVPDGGVFERCVDGSQAF
jgi:hypothetical protein